jgi:hypothetical protein
MQSRIFHHAFLEGSALEFWCGSCGYHKVREDSENLYSRDATRKQTRKFLEETREPFAVSDPDPIRFQIELPKGFRKGAAEIWELVKGPVASGLQALSLRLVEDQLNTFERILEKAAQISKNHGISIGPIPKKFLVKFVENAKNEDVNSDELCAAWASLLVNAATDFSSRHIQYAEILSKISHHEAMLLQLMYDRALNSGHLGYYLGEPKKGSFFPGMSFDGFERGELAHIRKVHPLRSIDNHRVSSGGILYVQDRFDFPGEEGQVLRGVLATTPDYDIVDVVDGMEKLGLVFHYGLAKTFVDGSRYECRWAELQRYGIGFLKAVSPPSASLKSGVESE